MKNSKASLARNSRSGMILFVALGLIAIMFPVILFLSSTASARTREVIRLRTEIDAQGIAIADFNYTLYALHHFIPNYNNIQARDELNALPSEIHSYYMGVGLFSQFIATLASKQETENSNYIFAAKAEHFLVLDENNEISLLPENNTIIVSDYWITKESMDLNQVKGKIALINSRGADVMTYEDLMTSEIVQSHYAYEQQLDKAAKDLPPQLHSKWNQAKHVLVKNKIEHYN